MFKRQRDVLMGSWSGCTRTRMGGSCVFETLGKGLSGFQDINSGYRAARALSTLDQSKGTNWKAFMLPYVQR